MIRIKIIIKMRTKKYTIRIYSEYELIYLHNFKVTVAYLAWLKQNNYYIFNKVLL